MKKVCDEDEELAPHLKSSDWAACSRILAPRVAEKFFASPLKAETNEEFRARQMLQWKTPEARAKMVQRLVDETEEEFQARRKAMAAVGVPCISWNQC